MHALARDSKGLATRLERRKVVTDSLESLVFEFGNGKSATSLVINCSCCRLHCCTTSLVISNFGDKLISFLRSPRGACSSLARHVCFARFLNFRRKFKQSRGSISLFFQYISFRLVVMDAFSSSLVSKNAFTAVDFADQSFQLTQRLA